MERVAQLIGDRRRVGEWYKVRLKNVPALTLPPEAPRCQTVYWLYSVLINEAGRRDSLMDELASAGIETRPFFHPVHHFPMYRRHPTDSGCPVACALSRCGINLPTSSYLTEPDINIITTVLRGLLTHQTAMAA